MSPRTLDPAVVTTVTSNSAEFVHLIEISFSTGFIRLSTGGQDLSWNSLTWQGVGGLLTFGGVEETADGKAQGVDLTLSGVDQTVLATLLGNQYRGRPVQIWRAYLSPVTGLVIGVPILLFKGLQLSPYNVEEERSMQGGTVKISTRLVGYFGVARIRGIKCNLISHQHQYSGDTFFQYTASLAHAKIYWGTTSPTSVAGSNVGPTDTGRNRKR